MAEKNFPLSTLAKVNQINAGAKMLMTEFRANPEVDKKQAGHKTSVHFA